MGSRPSLVHFYIQRLDSLMAIGESRHRAKQALRDASEEKVWSAPTGKIHSHATRRVYQQQILAFVDWAKATYGVSKPAVVDTHADEWVSQYLRVLIEQGRSPYTLQTARSALRLCFGREIAASVPLPRRQRRAITRSRVPVKQDAHFQPDHWPDLILFAKATGLRRSELRDVRVGEVMSKPDGTLSVHVRNGKGGKAREVPVLSGSEKDVLAIVAERDPKARVFDHIPKNMDVHGYRREFAQAYYHQLAPGRVLPSADLDRIKPADYDGTAVQAVSEALGHSRQRRSTVLNHYLLT